MCSVYIYCSAFGLFGELLVQEYELPTIIVIIYGWCAFDFASFIAEKVRLSKKEN